MNWWLLLGSAAAFSLIVAALGLKRMEATILGRDVAHRRATLVEARHLLLEGFEDWYVAQELELPLIEVRRMASILTRERR